MNIDLHSDYSPISGLQRERFQAVVHGKQTDLFFLHNSQGNEVAITNYGGAVVAIMVPDRQGRRANVIQGYDSIDAYLHAPEPYLSTLVGRCCNRIRHSQFQLDGKTYHLFANRGTDSLHGGREGFNAKVWTAQQLSHQSLALSYVSAYGQEGYPGELKVTVIYTFNDNNELIVDFNATTNRRTVLNLTSHGYFSLSGIGNPTPSVHPVVCQINADYYLPMDATSLPTGEIRMVEGTPFDFRQAKPIGRDIDCDDEQLRIGRGYDHCFLLIKREEGELSFAAKIIEPESGRSMEVYTTQPGMQFYTDNWADGYTGQLGATFPVRSGVCFETQHFPDSPNHPYFPSTRLEVGKRFSEQTIFRFGVE